VLIVGRGVIACRSQTLDGWNGGLPVGAFRRLVGWFRVRVGGGRWFLGSRT
jgi:hypothetical protein